METEIEPARRRLGDNAGLCTFQVADLTAMPEIGDATFDVVVGDFLIAAVAGHRPFREVECLKELVRVLKPGGRIVLTGWEIEGRTVRTSTQPTRTRRLFAELVCLREVLHILTGSVAYREHPSWWIEARLVDLGLPPERREIVTDIHRSFVWLVRQIRKQLADIEPANLRNALQDQTDQLENRVRSDSHLRVGVPIGQLYAVVACKLEGAILL